MGGMSATHVKSSVTGSVKTRPGSSANSFRSAIGVAAEQLDEIGAVSVHETTLLYDNLS